MCLCVSYQSASGEIFLDNRDLKLQVTRDMSLERYDEKLARDGTKPTALFSPRLIAKVPRRCHLFVPGRRKQESHDVIEILKSRLGI